MPLAKCPRTGKLFDNTKTSVHPAAMAEEEADFAKILDYIVSHPNSSPEEIVEETGVTVDCVLRLKTQGRLKELDTEAALKQEQDFLEEKKNQAKRDAERKARMLQELGGISRPKGESQASLGGVHNTLSEKRKR